ncbi:MAG: MerR family transcriptional regulator [Lysobacterales bacterium]|jgi:DNA-binding transcriptional MerR regulator
MYTIGQLAKKHKLSRSTLLYYDRIGVLSPSGRSEANYRLYTQQDLDKLERIMLFRATGLSLATIRQLLGRDGNDFNASLEQRLTAINTEIQALRGQQRVILKLLENEGLAGNSRVLTKETWVEILRASGLDEAGMENWHVEFERTSPEAHQDFLESIGIAPDEIDLIREWSRQDNPDT